jgi:TM2 domain-containing membrane protein YozV
MSVDYTMQQSIITLRRQLPPEELEVIDRQLETERKSSGLIALLAAIGLLGVAGVHRFVLGDVRKGIFMLLTLGGLGVWTIVDLVRANSFATRYNLNLEYGYLNAAVARHLDAQRDELSHAA